MSEIQFGVSVVLPIFMKSDLPTQLRLLRRALESAVDQDYPGPMEILLVDDGSPVPVREFSDELGLGAFPIRWLRSSENCGLVAALNLGLAHAAHPLIARLDADDRWLKNKISLQLRQFSADPDLTLSATGMSRVDDRGDQIDTHIRPQAWQDILGYAINKGCPFPHGSVIARKDIYRLLGSYDYGATATHCEDYTLWAIWIRFFKVTMIEQSLYEYTVSPNSMSALHADRQRTVTSFVRRSISNSGIGVSLPDAMRNLSASLRSSLFEAGVLSYFMWKNDMMPVRIPQSAARALQRVLPDRYVMSVQGEGLEWKQVVSGTAGEGQGSSADPSIIVRASKA
jgi:glycosyltransferase involved in cell wall biosynthesis